MSRAQWTVIGLLGTATVLVMVCLSYLLLEQLTAGRVAQISAPTQPVATLAPATPTATQQPRPTPTSTLPASTIGIWYACGHSFYVSVGEGPHGWGPWLRYQIDDASPRGIFLVVPMDLENLTNRTFDDLWETDYEVTGLVRGRRVTFTADQHASWNQAYGWRGYAYLSDHVPPGVLFHTLVVFDVDPEGRDWRLVFRPGSIYGSPICTIEIPLRPSPYRH